MPFVHVGRQHAELADELRAVVDGVLAESDAGHAAEVDAFEQDFAGFCGAQDAVGVAAGTAALSLGLIAAGIGPGDEVILPAYAPITTAMGVLYGRYAGLLRDARADTGLIDSTSAAELVGKRTAAIVAVHLFGQVCDMHRLGEFAERRPARRRGRGGGARRQLRRRPRRLVRRRRRVQLPPEPELVDGRKRRRGLHRRSGDRARVRRWDLGQRERGQHVEIGFEAGLDGLQAAVLRVKLRAFEQKNAARRAWASMYRAVLPASVTTLWEDPRGECVYHLFPVRLRTAMRSWPACTEPVSRPGCTAIRRSTRNRR